MPLGPVFRHEMLAAGRKRRYFVMASLIGLAMLGLLAIGYSVVLNTQRIEQYAAGEAVADSVGLSISGAAQLTGAFYRQFAWATMLGVLFVTPVVCAGAIASERERRTIEYLFATDLSNAEIVFDKLAARLLTVAKLVVAALPVLAIFRLLGGVPGDLLLTHFAMLASTATLAAAIALTVGVWCERARDAVPRALSTVVLSLLAAPLALGLYTLAMASGKEWAFWLGEWVFGPVSGFLIACNPLWVLVTSAGLGVTGGVLGIDSNPRAIAIMIGLQLLIAAVLLTVCVAVVRRVHLNAVSAPGAVRKGGSAATRTRSPYEAFPMLWKEMFASATPKRRPWIRRIGQLLILLTVFGPLIAMLVAYFRGATGVDGNEYAQAAGMYVGACGSLLMLVIGNRAAGLVSQERERDTWLSLLTSDLSAAEILRGKVLGNLYAHRWPIAGLALIPLLGSLLNPWLGASAVGVLLVTLLCGWAATAIGIAYSLRLSTSTKALVATTLTLVGIGLVYTALASGFLAVAGVGGEAVAVLALPPLVPMLFVSPIIVCYEPAEGVFVVTFVLGCLFYAFVGFLVSLSSEAAFDAACERGAGERGAGEWGAQPAIPTATHGSERGPLPGDPGPTGA